MRSEAFVSEMTSRIKGIGSIDLGSARTPRINVSDLAEIRIELPPIGVQADEVCQLQIEVEKIGTLIAETERFVERDDRRS
ncbi:MAG: hypothetical protein WAW17_16945 [Rhodococcus sp. (in: high G+C Gram-positive bacteria)]|uniref:hypothetical protein n=1 Tax=Rhodococcus sp. TaxID=1831 RepID=UPI003BB02416